MENPYTAESLAREERPAPLFGPVQAEERYAPPWDSRREAARWMLLAVEGLWLLAWALYWLRLSAPEPFTRTPLLVGGWFSLAALALVAGHLVMRGEETLGWPLSRALLGLGIAATTLFWWAAVSGGLLAFFADIGSLFRLRPGPGFWAFWLAILAWWRGLEWSQRVAGPRLARETIHSALFTVGLLALLAGESSVAPILPALFFLWLFGMVALGLTRLVMEDWALAVRRSRAFSSKQAALVAGSVLATLAVAGLLVALVEAERRASLSRWLLARAEGPLNRLLLLLVQLAVLVVTLLWTLFFWVVTQVGRHLGLRFADAPPPEPPLAGGQDALDALFRWLLSLPPTF